jgi:hypothetical protein
MCKEGTYARSAQSTGTFVTDGERERRVTNEGAGGRGGIRTHEGLAPLAVFKTAALNHSATLPSLCSQ